MKYKSYLLIYSIIDKWDIFYTNHIPLLILTLKITFFSILQIWTNDPNVLMF